MVVCMLGECVGSWEGEVVGKSLGSVLGDFVVN